MRCMLRNLAMICGAFLLVSTASIAPMAQVFSDPIVVACGNATQPAEIAEELRQAASLAANLSTTKQLDLELSSVFGQNLFSSPLYTSPRSLSLSELRNLEQLVSQRIEELETIALGPNRECREIAGVPGLSDQVLFMLLNNELNQDLSSPLARLYLYQNLTRSLLVLRATSGNLGDGFHSALSDELLEQTRILAQSIAESSSYEIALARASVVFTPLFLALSLSEDEELTLSVLNPQLWKSLACGEEILIPEFNIQLNGSLAVTDNGTQTYPMRQAGAELWAFTSTLLNIILILFNPSYGDSYLEEAIGGCTPELREHAANLYISLHPEIAYNSDQLESLITEGQSEELRWAAAAFLAPVLARDPTLTNADLQGIALRSTSVMLRSASGHALGLRWMRNVNDGELDYTGTFQYPPNGGITRESGTLTQFALSHAGVHPELAQAAVLPLFTAFKLVSGRP